MVMLFVKEEFFSVFVLLANRKKNPVITNKIKPTTSLLDFYVQYIKSRKFHTDLSILANFIMHLRHLHDSSISMESP